LSENPIKKGFITKIVGADLPLETERNVAGVAGLALLDAVETDFGFDIEIYKKHKAGGIGVVPQQEQFMESMPYWEPHLKPKIYRCHARRKLACGNAHADNVPALWVDLLW
jgi:homoserine kinase